MNQNVVEILSLLVKRIMDEEYIFEQEEELVEYLLTQGYSIEDIDAALKVIFLPGNRDRVLDLSPLAGVELKGERVRILHLREKMRLSIKAQGVLTILQQIGVFDLQQWEYLFFVLFNNFDEEIGLSQLWEGLEIVADQGQLVIIARLCEEFKPYQLKLKKYLN